MSGTKERPVGALLDICVYEQVTGRGKRREMRLFLSYVGTNGPRREMLEAGTLEDARSEAAALLGVKESEVEVVP